MSYHDYNGDDTLDSRELAELLTEMASDRADLVDAAEEWEQTDEEQEAAKRALADWDDEHGEQYKALEEFCNEAEQYCSDWHHGATLILDEHWADYAQQLVEDVGDIPRNMPTYVVVDWEATADNLKADYTAVEWGAYTYWVR